MGENAYIAKLVLIIALLLSWVFLLSKRNKLESLKYLVYWAGIFIILFVLYLEKDRILPLLMPGRAEVINQGLLEFYRATDGHFYVNLEINGATVNFVVDTGASTIVLTPQDAKKVGVDLTNLDYLQFYQTANGVVRAASVKLANVRLGDIALKDVPAAVIEGQALDRSLLGITFLNHFEYYKFEGDTLYLKYESSN